MTAERPDGAIDLPDGEWALLRNPRKVPERLRNPLRTARARLYRCLAEAQTAAAPDAAPGAGGAFGAPPAQPKAEMADPDPEILGPLLYAYGQAAFVALVESWSFPLAVCLETLGDIPGDAFDVLDAALGPLADEVLPSLGPKPKAEGEPAVDPEDDDSPTQP